MTLNLDPTQMDRAQIRHLQDVCELWTRYDQVAHLQEQFRGAMGWKNVKGAEYLTAYFQDPSTGKKVMKSLGRRSPETEAKKDSFDRSRAEVDKALDELKRDLEPLIRVGKALKIGRMEPAAGDVLRELSRMELLGPDLFIIGSTCLYLYEASAGVLLPRSIMAEGDLDLLSSAHSRQERLEDLLPVIRRVDRSFSLHEGSRTLRNDKGFRIHMHTHQSLRWALDELSYPDISQLRVLREMLDLPPVKAVAIARDGLPVGMWGMDPRLFSLLKFAKGNYDTVYNEYASELAGQGAASRMAKDQAYAVGRLVARFGSRPFEDDQLAAFPALAESIETGDPEAAETAGRFLRI
jgi:hypothetical protein